jgi:multimeric flavodoxin WrbA
MKIIAINGSPRKNWNTATLLNQALAGAASAGAETELIHLYPLNFKGCASCFCCKRTGAKRVCALRDDLAPVLEKLCGADAAIFGSPIYLMSVTSELKACLERFVYPYITYMKEKASHFPRRLPIAFIYTSGAPQGLIEQVRAGLNPCEGLMDRVFYEKPETLFSYNTWQFQDYDQYEHSAFDLKDKARQKAEQFPRDCEAARKLGTRLAARAKELAVG